MTIPFVTLIIPTHKRPELLKRALNSINIQKFREEIEVIVVSDAEDYKTILVCNENLNSNDIYVRRNGISGPSASRNIGLKLAKGRNIMFLDDDDAWDQNFFENLKRIDANIYFNYFDCNVIKEQRLELGPVKTSECFINLENALDLNVFVKNQIHMSCLIFNSSLIKDEQFDCSMRAYEDWDFLLNIYKNKFPMHVPITCSNIFEVDDDTTDRRGSSADATNFNAIIDYLYVYRRHQAPNEKIKNKRKLFLESAGLQLPNEIF